MHAQNGKPGNIDDVACPRGPVLDGVLTPVGRSEALGAQAAKIRGDAFEVGVKNANSGVSYDAGKAPTCSGPFLLQVRRKKRTVYSHDRQIEKRRKSHP